MSTSDDLEASHGQAEDTSVAARRVQIALLRRATPAQRFARQRALSAWVLSLARRGLERRMPGAPRAEIDIAFIRHCYGDDLARAFRAWLNR